MNITHMIMCFTSIGPTSELMLNAGDKRIVYLRGARGWLSHGLVVTLPISYSLDGGTLWGFTCDMRIADCTTSFANFGC